MLFAEYQDVAITTAVYPAYCAVWYPLAGLTGEAAELVEKTLSASPDDEDYSDLLKEVGDVMWYISALDRDAEIGFDVDYDTLVPLGDVKDTLTNMGLDDFDTAIEDQAVDVAIVVGKINEIVKKVYRDKNGVFPDDKKDELNMHFGTIVQLLAWIAEGLGSSLEEVGRKNIEKLLSRQARGVIQGSGDNR